MGRYATEMVAEMQQPNGHTICQVEPRNTHRFGRDPKLLTLYHAAEELCKRRTRRHHIQEARETHVSKTANKKENSTLTSYVTGRKLRRAGGTVGGKSKQRPGDPAESAPLTASPQVSQQHQ